MRETVGRNEGVRVVRPMKRAELRLQGLDDSVTQDELLCSVAEVADCRVDVLSLGEVKTFPNRPGSAWLRCPVAVYNKLVEKGRWCIGWSTVVAKPLPARPMRCLRCLEVGHGAALCRGEDRSGRCYKCSDHSHTAKACKAGRLRCPLCADLGLPAEHALGAAACVKSRRDAQRKIAAKAKERKRTQEKGARLPPTEGSGGGSRGGPCGTKPPEPSAPAGPEAQGRVTRSKAGASHPPCEPAKGPTEGGGRVSRQSSFKRTAAERSPPIQRGEQPGGTSAEPPPPPPPVKKKKRARGDRYLTD